MPIRSQLAIGFGRLGGSLSRALRLGGGTSLPGAIALTIDPGLIRSLAAGLDRGSVVVTATNGKTTTANMLAAIFSAAGLRAVHNAAGANLAYGIATALMADGSDPSDPRIGLFEVDEATVRNVVPDLAPRAMLVGNIFRDQLDRFGEVDQTAKLIAAGIDLLPPGAKLVLNADDPRVAALGRDRDLEVIYYGLADDQYTQAGPAGAQDSKDCLVCGHQLHYHRRFFSHLGDYRCGHCGFSRPKPTVTAQGLALSLQGSSFKLTAPLVEAEINLPIPAIYNVYNALGAVALALALGVEVSAIRPALEGFKAAFGRFEAIDLNGRRLHLMLIKNPTGFNQAIEALNIDPSPKRVMIAINDNLADGTDVSWLWDVDLENLGPISWLMAGGVRAHDMALRLKYAGLAESQLHVETEFSQALTKAVEATPSGGNLYILPTYTAMLEIRQRLEALAGVKAFWRPEGER